MNLDRWVDKKLISKHKHIYMPMLKTAEVVASRYNISRESQDEYSLQSQLRTAKGQEEENLMMKLFQSLQLWE